MIDILWPILAIFAALSTCGILLVAHFFKAPSQYLNLIARAIVSIAFLPILFFIPWPTDPIFYLCVIATGSIVSYTDTIAFNATAKYGAGPIARIMPLSIFFTFFAWLAFEPRQIFDYLETPLSSLAILAALTGCAYFASAMRKCSVSLEILKELIGPIALTGIAIALAKVAFDHSEFHSGVYYYILVQAVTIVTIFMLLNKFSNFKHFQFDYSIVFSKKILTPGLIFFAAMMVHMVSKNYANTLTPNPAYVMALVMTTPVWMLLIYKIMSVKEEANISAGIGLMICAIALALITV